MNEKEIAEYTVTMIRKDGVYPNTVVFTGTYSDLRVYKNISGTHWCVCKDFEDENGEEKTTIQKFLVSEWFVILN